MNIGSLIRGLLGDSKPGDIKQLDVKTGQVVRGVVLSVSDDGQEAEIQIQGVKVHAKLETPLQQGQATMMQVQPPGEDGMMVLKPLSESPYTSLTAKSMGDVLTAVGLTDTKANREMIQTLQASGVPLTKENAALFKTILMEKPVGVPPEQWLQSAAIAFQRGLPMTSESVRGLQQAVFGPPLHELLSGLSDQLTLLSNNAGDLESKGMATSQVAVGASQVSAALGTQDTAGKSGNTGNAVGAQVTQGSQGAQSATGMSNEADGKGAASQGTTLGTAAKGGAAVTPLQPLLAKLQDVLQQLRGTQLPANPSSQSATTAVLPATATPSGGNITGVATPVADSLAGVVTPPASATAAAPGGTAAMVVPPATQTAASMGEAPAGASQQPAPTQGEAPWVGRMLKLLGAEHEQQALRGGATPQAQQAPQGTAAAGNVPLGNTAVPVPQAPPTQAAGNIAPTPLQSSVAVPVTLHSNAATPTTSSPLATQEQIAQAASETPLAHVAKGTPEVMLRAVTSMPTVPGNVMSTEVAGLNQDSLKGFLLEMLDRTDLPPALREAAQQLVQQMTGQQLLLNTDRTAPFAQVTMFIPLNGQDGQETASVHIQARRGKKGELDASNCRLWFDLDMKHLGATLVDVQVVDKIVSLKIHNDHEWITSLIEDRRDEISQAIHSIGYQLLSLKSESLPLPTVAEVDGKQGSVTSEYIPPTYKGVDMKI